MQRRELIWGAVQRMTLYGAGAGAFLGLLYFWAGTFVGVLLGFVVGMITGLVEGLMMIAFINFAVQAMAEIRRYRYVIGTFNCTVTALITLVALYIVLPGGERVLSWELLTLVVFIAFPVLFASTAAWWASARVLTWVQDQSKGAAGR